MKKYITSLVMAAMMAVSVPMLASTAQAQQGSESGYYNNGYYDNGYYNDGYNNRSNPREVYNRHRKAVNIAASVAAGALLGALLGGKKGALIGAGVGAVGGAVVTKKQRPRNYGYRY